MSAFDIMSALQLITFTPEQLIAYSYLSSACTHVHEQVIVLDQLFDIFPNFCLAQTYTIQLEVFPLVVE